NLGYKLMDLKTRKVYSSRDVAFFEKKEEDTPPSDSPDVYFSLVVEKKVDIPADDESDDGDDGNDQIEPQPMGVVQCIPKWYTNMLRDAKLD
ncbi:hypothetical protein KI387_011876, partial [Taxus chinensis]